MAAGSGGCLARPLLFVLQLLLSAPATHAVDHGQKTQQMVGSVRAVRSLAH